MTNEEAVARAEKELDRSEINLETAVRRGAPEGDIRNLVEKTNYRRYVLESLKSVKRWEKKCQELKQELADLRGDSTPRKHWACTRTRIRPVIRIGKDGTETHYPSVSDGADSVDARPCTITKACRTGKPYAGYDWRYADED